MRRRTASWWPRSAKGTTRHSRSSTGATTRASPPTCGAWCATTARAEDLAQDAFFSALRRIRATDAEIAFKPWIFEIARNAAIDHWRRTSRAEEVPVDEQELLRPADRLRLVGSAAPDAAVIDKERLVHLQGAFDELSEVHTRVLVMRELEGMSYREIAARLELSRSSVESALFRARRRLESEYADISEGRRCESMRGVMGRLAEGLRSRRDEARLARHVRRCHVCRRRAGELGIEPPAPGVRLRQKVAALLPLPLLGPASGHAGAALAERAAAVVAALAIAGAGGMALSGGGPGIGFGSDERDAASPRDAQERGAGEAAPAPRLRERSQPRRPGAAERERAPAPERGRQPRAGAPADAPGPAAGPGPVPPAREAPALPQAPTLSAPGAVPIPEAPALPPAPAAPKLTPPELPAGVQAPAAVPLDSGAVTDGLSGALD